MVSENKIVAIPTNYQLLLKVYPNIYVVEYIADTQLEKIDSDE